MNIASELFNVDWEFFQDILQIPAYTQALGMRALKEGFEGMLVPSLANPGKHCLVVFVENMFVSSEIGVNELAKLAIIPNQIFEAQDYILSGTLPFELKD